MASSTAVVGANAQQPQYWWTHRTLDEEATQPDVTAAEEAAACLADIVKRVAEKAASCALPSMNKRGGSSSGSGSSTASLYESQEKQQLYDSLSLRTFVPERLAVLRKAMERTWQERRAEELATDAQGSSKNLNGSVTSSMPSSGEAIDDRARQQLQALERQIYMSALKAVLQGISQGLTERGTAIAIAAGKFHDEVLSDLLGCLTDCFLLDVCGLRSPPATATSVWHGGLIHALCAPQNGSEETTQKQLTKTEVGARYATGQCVLYIHQLLKDELHMSSVERVQILPELGAAAESQLAAMVTHFGTEASRLISSPAATNVMLTSKSKAKSSGSRGKKGVAEADANTSEAQQQQQRHHADVCVEYISSCAELMQLLVDGLLHTNEVAVCCSNTSSSGGWGGANSPYGLCVSLLVRTASLRGADWLCGLLEGWLHACHNVADQAQCVLHGKGGAAVAAASLQLLAESMKRLRLHAMRVMFVLHQGPETSITAAAYTRVLADCFFATDAGAIGSRHHHLTLRGRLKACMRQLRVLYEDTSAEQRTCGSRRGVGATLAFSDACAARLSAVLTNIKKSHTVASATISAINNATTAPPVLGSQLPAANGEDDDDATVLGHSLLQQPASTLQDALAWLLPVTRITCDVNAIVALNSRNNSEERAAAFEEGPMALDGVATIFFPQYYAFFTTLETSLHRILEEAQSSVAVPSISSASAWRELLEDFLSATLDDACVTAAREAQEVATSELLMFYAFVCSPQPLYPEAALSLVRGAIHRFFAIEPRSRTAATTPGQKQEQEDIEDAHGEERGHDESTSGCSTMLEYMHTLIVKQHRKGTCAFFLPLMRAIGVDGYAAKDYDSLSCALGYPASVEVAYLLELSRAYFARQQQRIALNANNDALAFLHRLVFAHLQSSASGRGGAEATEKEEEREAEETEKKNGAKSDGVKASYEVGLFVEIIAECGLALAGRINGVAAITNVPAATSITAINIDAAVALFVSVMRLCISVSFWDAAARQALQGMIAKRLSDVVARISQNKVLKVDRSSMEGAEAAAVLLTVDELPAAYMYRELHSSNTTVAVEKKEKKTAASATPRAWEKLFWSIDYEDLDGVHPNTCAKALLRACNVKYTRHIPTKTILGRKSALEAHAQRRVKEGVVEATQTKLRDAVAADMAVVLEQHLHSEREKVVAAAAAAAETERKRKEEEEAERKRKEAEQEASGEKLDGAGGRHEDGNEEDHKAVTEGAADAANPLSPAVDAPAEFQVSAKTPDVAPTAVSVPLAAAAATPALPPLLTNSALRDYVQHVHTHLLKRALLSPVDAACAGVATREMVQASRAYVEPRALLDFLLRLTYRLTARLALSTRHECVSLSIFLHLLLTDIVLPYKMEFLAEEPGEWRKTLPGTERDAVALLKCAIGDVLTAIKALLKRATFLGDWGAYIITHHAARVLRLVSTHNDAFMAAVEQRRGALRRANIISPGFQLLVSVDRPLVAGMTAPAPDVAFLFTKNPPPLPPVLASSPTSARTAGADVQRGRSAAAAMTTSATSTKDSTRRRRRSSSRGGRRERERRDRERVRERDGDRMDGDKASWRNERRSRKRVRSPERQQALSRQGGGGDAPPLKQRSRAGRHSRGGRNRRR